MYAFRRPTLIALAALTLPAGSALAFNVCPGWNDPLPEGEAAAPMGGTRYRIGGAITSLTGATASTDPACAPPSNLGLHLPRIPSPSWGGAGAGGTTSLYPINPPRPLGRRPIRPFPRP